MDRIAVLALPLATLLLPLAACGPKNNGHSTTPPRIASTTPDPSSDPGAAAPRTNPPPKATPSTPPTTSPTGIQCPPAGGAGLSAVLWQPAKAHLRRYLNETRLDKIITTKANPVEVCGARGQIAWLLRARCPGGGAPFSDGHTAHRSRAGNVGSGGRCGKIVDLYKVPCPKKTYSIFMSLYHCTPGQKFP
jgi:hypothetical protein